MTTSKKTELEPASPAAEPEQRYTKEQLLASQRFAADRDVLAALLDAGKGYTLGTARQLLDDFYQGEVQA